MRPRREVNWFAILFFLSDGDSFKQRKRPHTMRCDEQEVTSGQLAHIERKPTNFRVLERDPGYVRKDAKCVARRAANRDLPFHFDVSSTQPSAQFRTRTQLCEGRAEISSGTASLFPRLERACCQPFVRAETGRLSLFRHGGAVFPNRRSMSRSRERENYATHDAVRTQGQKILHLRHANGLVRRHQKISCCRSAQSSDPEPHRPAVRVSKERKYSAENQGGVGHGFPLSMYAFRRFGARGRFISMAAWRDAQDRAASVSRPSTRRYIHFSAGHSWDCRGRKKSRAASSG
jgi:hypothetical protein